MVAAAVSIVRNLTKPGARLQHAGLRKPCTTSPHFDVPTQLLRAHVEPRLTRMACAMQRRLLMDTLRIKNQLLARRHDLLARYHDELARANEELESTETENVDKASEQWDVRVLSILGQADVAALDRIVAALRRLDHGTYGTCTECANAIEQARLLVLPEAATCIDCALETERAKAPGVLGALSTQFTPS